MLTQEYVKSILQYNENTGIFTWGVKPNRRIKIGNQTTKSLDRYGYSRIKINKRYYKSHRLAWLYIYGQWPKNQIDHINGIRSDNRIDNLRVVSNKENCQNRYYHRNGKLVGSTYIKRSRKWQVQTTINKINTYIGLYKSEQLANEAYLAMEWLLRKVASL